MNAEGHLDKANEIQRSLDKLFPDLKGENVVAVVELTYGVAQHLIAYGMEKKHGLHLDTHVGLPRELRRIGEEDIATIFENLDTFRAGRWYGKKGNGDIVKQCVEFIAKIKKWAEL